MTPLFSGSPHVSRRIRRKNSIYISLGLMFGKLTSLENGPERNVKLAISATELSSEISSPPGVFPANSVEHYDISGLQDQEKGPVTLHLALADGRRVCFYATESKFDMALLLDQLDGTIGERPRHFT